MSAVTGSRRADHSALEALVDAAAGILAADSLSDTLTRIAHHLAGLVDFDEISVYEVREEMLVSVSESESAARMPAAASTSASSAEWSARREPVTADIWDLIVRRSPGLDPRTPYPDGA